MVRRLPGRPEEGAVTFQRFEHCRPFDRLEGGSGRYRTSFGRYEWLAGQRFEGPYDANVPNGWGTVTIDGTSFPGILAPWLPCVPGQGHRHRRSIEQLHGRPSHRTQSTRQK